MSMIEGLGKIAINYEEATGCELKEVWFAKKCYEILIKELRDSTKKDISLDCRSVLVGGVRVYKCNPNNLIGGPGE